MCLRGDTCIFEARKKRKEKKRNNTQCINCCLNCTFQMLINRVIKYASACTLSLKLFYKY